MKSIMTVFTLLLLIFSFAGFATTAGDLDKNSDINIERSIDDVAVQSVDVSVEVSDDILILDHHPDSENPRLEKVFQKAVESFDKQYQIRTKWQRYLNDIYDSSDSFINAHKELTKSEETYIKLIKYLNYRYGLAFSYGNFVLS